MVGVGYGSERGFRIYGLHVLRDSDIVDHVFFTPYGFCNFDNQLLDFENVVFGCFKTTSKC